MALSLREKSTISRRIKENVALLSAGSLKLREKSTVSRAIKEDVALLMGEKLGEAVPDANSVFLQEVIAGKHDSENVVDLAQKVIDAGEIVVATDDALVASAIDKFVSLDLSVFG